MRTPNLSIAVLYLAVVVAGVAWAQAAENLGQMVNDTRALRTKLLEDPHRPGYHFVTPEGRCGSFDPNAAIFWNGRYHLMYIFQNAKGPAAGAHRQRDRQCPGA